MLGLIPGMPNIVFLLMSSLIGYYAWWLAKRQREAAARPVATKEDPAPQANAEATWDDLQPVDALGLEVGYRLITLVDKTKEGDLLSRIKGVRQVLHAGLPKGACLTKEFQRGLKALADRGYPRQFREALAPDARCG